MTPPRVLVLGLARNCAATLPVFFGWVDSLSSAFRISALIGENGSSDQTRHLIVDAERAGMPVVLVDTSEMAAIGDRLRRMAVGRERLLQQAKSERADIVVVADLDSVMRRPPDIVGLQRAIDLLASAPELIAVTASSRPHYYDVLAYRDHSTNFDGLNERIQQAQRSPLLYYRFMYEQVFSEQIRLTRLGPRRCYSAFNGLAVYRYADYVRGSYLGGGSGICEHVVFHHSLDSGTEERVAVIDELCIATPPEHAPVGPVSFYMGRIWRTLRRTLAGQVRL